MPARCLKSSADRCGDWPAPELPNDTWDGSRLASASKSFTLRADDASLTTSTLGTEITSVTGAKSVGLYGSVLYRA
ncbi:hypothetical protein D3C86_1376050 [compost metagenome]